MFYCVFGLQSLVRCASCAVGKNVLLLEKALNKVNVEGGGGSQDDQVGSWITIVAGSSTCKRKR